MIVFCNLFVNRIRIVILFFHEPMFYHCLVSYPTIAYLIFESDMDKINGKPKERCIEYKDNNRNPW